MALLEKRVKARIELRPEFKPLLTVSGIGEILGLIPLILVTASFSKEMPRDPAPDPPVLDLTPSGMVLVCRRLLSF